MNNNYNKQRQWSDHLIPNAKNIILDNFNNIQSINDWDITISTPEQDMKEAADLILSNNKYQYMIALRLRDFKYMIEYPYEFTIRREYTQGFKTEYEKVLSDGYVDLFFYGFKQNNEIVRWILLDANVYRKQHYFDKHSNQWYPNDEILYEIKENHDGRNNFIAYDITSFPEELIIANSLRYFEDVKTYYMQIGDKNKKIHVYKNKR